MDVLQILATRCVYEDVRTDMQRHIFISTQKSVVHTLKRCATSPHRSKWLRSKATKYHFKEANKNAAV